MAQNSYRVVITAQSPLSFSQRKPGGIFQESLTYVPGSTLRGATADTLLNGAMQDHLSHLKFQPDCDFCQCFLGQQAAVFTNAYPVGPKSTAETPFVLPATAVSCKHQQGFSQADGHGVFDTLIDRLCWETLEPTGLLYGPDCPHCHERVESYSTVFTRDQAGRYQRQEVSQRLLTRVAINRRRAVAEEGLLYSPWVIEEVTRDEQSDSETDFTPTTFVGALYGAEQAVASAVESLTTVGGGSSRGLNHVQIKVVPITVEDYQAVKQRVAHFNRLIDTVWPLYQALGGQDKPKAGHYFTLDLQAQTILKTPYGEPTMVVDEAILEQATGGQLKSADINLVRSYTSYGYVTGWNSAWKLPKQAEVCAQTGSVFLFQAPNGLNDEQLKALAALQQRGIGLRTGEGFGQVRICDEFHLVRRDGQDPDLTNTLTSGLAPR